MISALGTFRYGIVPGIKTIDKVADDVHRQNLHIVARQDEQHPDVEVSFINSKGFGGNNATAVLLAPRRVEKMLRKRYGDAAFEDYLKRREQTRANAAAYDQQALKGQFDIIYNFGSDMIDDQAIELGTESIKVPGFSQPLVFRKDARYSDMLD
ncbi:hypothetical protein D3C76_1316990 [compost metagenome]